MSVCKRCFKPGHEANRCRVGFMKSWPGHPAMILKLRTPKGTIQLTCPLSPELADAAMDLIRRASDRETNPVKAPDGEIGFGDHDSGEESKE